MCPKAESQKFKQEKFEIGELWFEPSFEILQVEIYQRKLEF